MYNANRVMFDEQNYESKQEREEALLNEFEKFIQSELQAINLAKASIRLAAAGFNDSYGVDFSDEANTMIEDA